MTEILTSVDDFGEQFIQAEKFCRLSAARVMFADYALIVRDFAPRFGKRESPIDDAKRAAIDDFLIDHSGVISIPQARQTVTNTRIPIERGHKLGYRLPYYGRAAVMQVSDPPRLLDIKGCGVQPGGTPVKESHSTGLLLASDAIHEFLFAGLCAAAFQHARASFAVLPCYAVIDLGFHAVAWRSHRVERAVMLVRRAHRRPRTLWDDDEPPSDTLVRVMRDMALLLGRYGIASTAGDYRLDRHSDGLVLHARGENFVFKGEEAARVAAATRYSGGTLPIDAINFQCTAGQPQLFDFGSFHSRSEFSAPIFIASSAAEVDLIGEFVHPDDPRFPCADICRIPKRANRLASKWAGQYARGEIDGASIGGEIEQFVRQCFRKLQERQRLCRRDD